MIRWKERKQEKRKSAVQGSASIPAPRIGTVLSILEVKWTICGGVTAKKQFPHFHVLDVNSDHSTFHTQWGNRGISRNILVFVLVW